MAKRKRLTLRGEAPPVLGQPGTEPQALYSLGASHSMAPIAHVAGEASALLALSDLAGEMASAREAGLMILSLSLDRIEADYPVRGRILIDEAELEVLMQSLRARGPAGAD